MYFIILALKFAQKCQVDWALTEWNVAVTMMVMMVMMVLYVCHTVTVSQCQCEVILLNVLSAAADNTN